MTVLVDKCDLHNNGSPSYFSLRCAGYCKFLPHGSKEIQHHAALQTDAAVHHAVLLEQGVAGAYLPGLVPDGKAVPPGDDIGDLGVGVAVHPPLSVRIGPFHLVNL